MYINVYINIYICIYIYIYVYVYIYIYIYIFRVVDLPCLQQRFDDCLFQVSFCVDNFYYLHFILSRFLHVTLL